jgi:SPRY domain
VYVGAYGIDDEPSIFQLVISSIVDRESFKKQCTKLDSATRDYVITRLDYYQVNIGSIGQYRADSSLIVVDNFPSIAVKKTSANYYYTGLIWDVSIHKYTVTINASSSTHSMVGFAPSKLFNVFKSNHTLCGWYIYLSNGYLYSQNDGRGKAYSSGCKVGDSITCIYNASTREISFERNGVSLGVVYTNVNGEDIAPAVELFDKGDSITLTID